MLKSFQALVSILMSDKETKPDVIDDHVKLFVSSVHYLRKNHGTLSHKDGDDVIKMEMMNPLPEVPHATA